jgi:hypothetical protein
MKLFFAAPLSGLPSDPMALGAQASRLHFVRKAVRAAPASSRPFFPIALLSHVPGACAAAVPIANAVIKTASISRVIFILYPWRGCEARAVEGFWPFLILNAFLLAQFRAMTGGSRKTRIAHCFSVVLLAKPCPTLVDFYL